VWNIDEGKAISTRKLKKFGAYCITFTPDGKFLVTGHDDHNCYITPVEAPK
jgi:WD40 repeat protein